MRTFVLTDPKLYVRLYKQYVIPGVLYAAPVWNTGMIRNRNLISKMHRRFIRRVAFRCNIQTRDFNCDDILALLDECDIKMFEKIRSQEDRSGSFFDTVVTATRSSVNVQAKAIARRELVNKMFAWRVSRVSRQS